MEFLPEEARRSIRMYRQAVEALKESGLSISPRLEIHAMPDELESLRNDETITEKVLSFDDGARYSKRLLVVEGVEVFAMEEMEGSEI